LKKDAHSREKLKKMIDKSHRSLEVAKNLLNTGSYDFAISRAYYAVFYVMEAVLLTKNLSYSKHSAVIGAFNKNFIKTGLFPPEFGKQVTRLFRDRQNADYDFDVIIPLEKAEEEITDAETIISRLETYLVEEHYLDSIENSGKK
jgi:uncharacterized protein (UPF0332 family)